MARALVSQIVGVFILVSAFAGATSVLFHHISPTALAQGVGAIFATGGSSALGSFGRPMAVPAYLKSVNITTATTTLIKDSTGVLGCVVVNKAGASGSTLTLYDILNGTKIATVDTGTAIEFCYASIFPDYLYAVTATGGAAANITITYR